ncbi:UNVERIFIED_CONTAM: hypothetical protein RMT77_013586 [Armadillidium vulgare]
MFWYTVPCLHQFPPKSQSLLEVSLNLNSTSFPEEHILEVSVLRQQTLFCYLLHHQTLSLSGFILTLYLEVFHKNGPHHRSGGVFGTWVKLTGLTFCHTSVISLRIIIVSVEGISRIALSA